MSTISKEPIKILDHGYIRYVEHLGSGDADVPEAGIIEAARQSTQASFRSWSPYTVCEHCGWWCPIPETNMPEQCEIGFEGKHKLKYYDRGDEGLLSFLFSGKPQHATPFEFCELVIEVQAPIFVFREWHRHRTQSYNEMSARYSPLPDLNYVPDWEVLKQRGLAATKNSQATGVVPFDEEKAWRWWTHLLAMYHSDERFYQQGLQAGVPKELARITLPVGRYSRMRAKANLRNWLAFLTLRSDNNAQYEIRQYAIALETIIEACFPRTYALFVKRRASAT